jgi:hypothetical protein
MALDYYMMPLDHYLIVTDHFLSTNFVKLPKFDEVQASLHPHPHPLTMRSELRRVHALKL